MGDNPYDLLNNENNGGIGKNYIYDDNRNLRELIIYPNPRDGVLGKPIYDACGNALNKIKQKYVYTSKLFNRSREFNTPLLPDYLPFEFVRSTQKIKFTIPENIITNLKENILDYWLAIYMIHILVVLYIWEPSSEYLTNNGKRSGDEYEEMSLSNISVDNEAIRFY